MVPEPIPLVRCRLGGPEEGETASVRYVLLSEFGLWRHLMETRHRRTVRLEAASWWVSEEAAREEAGLVVDELEPVVRLRVDVPGPGGLAVPVERFFPVETYPRARAALLAHFDGSRRPRRILATAGYFLPPWCLDDGRRAEDLGAAS
jgi:hypothetical protein